MGKIYKLHIPERKKSFVPKLDLLLSREIIVLESARIDVAIARYKEKAINGFMPFLDP